MTLEMQALIPMVVRLLAATGLGAAVGLQRELSGRPAGLRTHAMVCLGATLITLASESYPGDEARIAAQIVSGIGFLGAGTIIREGHTVRGLTTAASLWAAAGLGICCGRGGTILWLACISTLIIVLTLGVGKTIEDRILSARERNLLIVRADHGVLPQVLQALIDSNIVVESAVRRLLEDGHSAVALYLHLPQGMERTVPIQTVMSVQGVRSAAWSANISEGQRG